MKRITMIIGAVALGSCLIGCGGGEEQARVDRGGSAFLLASAPAGAVEVRRAKAEAKEGDSVVLSGRIGGRVEPFSAERAVFMLMDSALPTCDDKEDDHCSTPWDYCCETPQDITANSATVQVVGEDGRPLALDLRRIAGLKPMDRVVVVGTVGSRPTPEVLVVSATGVFVER